MARPPVDPIAGISHSGACVRAPKFGSNGINVVRHGVYSYEALPWASRRMNIECLKIIGPDGPRGAEFHIFKLNSRFNGKVIYLEGLGQAAFVLSIIQRDRWH
jgi:hypothetical protein